MDDFTQDPNEHQNEPTSNIPDFTAPVYEPYPKKKKGSGWKIFWGIVIVLSILANGIMFIGIIGMAAVMSAGGGGGGSFRNDGIEEKVLVDGSHRQKIAVVNLVGIIDGQMSDWVRRQVEHAESDKSVKGVILRINSPGGGVSASDQIHYYISQFKEKTNKPVLGFMQSVAASGGYYSAVACDEIMSEPTTITGSIGVIMNYLVVKELLEEKLGINPITIKSGKRKDWPSMFHEPSDEQKDYLNETIVIPAYDRFVNLVDEGRTNLAEYQVRELADGSIFTAPEAMKKGLIDEIGYFDSAVDKAQSMAGISNAQVIEYREIFSFWTMMGAQSKNPTINIESELLDKLAAPRLLYLWDGRK